MQAGEKVKALKCLIRSGNTDKIIFFAGVSRNAEIYTLAANYLQTLNWHSPPDLTQSIVTFYTKVPSLSSYTFSCNSYDVEAVYSCSLPHVLQSLQKHWQRLSCLCITKCSMHAYHGMLHGMRQQLARMDAS